MPAGEPADPTSDAPIRSRAGAAEYGPRAGQQFVQAERFGHVIVGAQLETDHPVDLLTTRAGGDDHGNVRTGADLTQDIETTFAPQAKVEHDEVTSFASR